MESKRERGSASEIALPLSGQFQSRIGIFPSLSRRSELVFSMTDAEHETTER